jgi:membrane protein DedA with SNARE-associated domain
MTVASLIDQYGYWALVIGTFWEGEIVLTLGAYAARLGHLQLLPVLGCGALGVFLSDHTCFILGRCGRRQLLRRWPRLGARLQRPLALLERHQDVFIVSFQFIPGSATLTPLALGMSAVSWRRFFVLDLIGILVWTMIVGLSGYGCAALVGLVWGRLPPVLGWSLLAATGAGLISLWWYLRRFWPAGPIAPAGDAPISSRSAPDASVAPVVADAPTPPNAPPASRSDPPPQARVEDVAGAQPSAGPEAPHERLIPGLPVVHSSRP